MVPPRSLGNHVPGFVAYNGLFVHVGHADEDILGEGAGLWGWGHSREET